MHFSGSGLDKTPTHVVLFYTQAAIDIDTPGVSITREIVFLILRNHVGSIL